MRKSGRFLIGNLCLIFLGPVSVVISCAQTPPVGGRSATVSLVMPLLLEGNDSIPGGSLDVEPYLLSAKGKKRLRLVSRKYIGNKGNFIDKFEIRVPPGAYRLQFKGLEYYALPTFDVAANETYIFRLPKERLLNPDVCMNEDIDTKTVYPGETDRDYERRYREEPFHKLMTDVLSLEKPFELVVQYCKKNQEGDIVRYGPVRFYYKNVYVEATDMVVDRTQRKVEATAYYVEVGGVRQETTKNKFEFSY